MKLKLGLLFILSCLILSDAFSQRAQIGLISESAVRATITSVSNDSLQTDQGRIALSEIKYVEFASRSKSFKNIYREIKAVRIKPYFKPIFEAKCFFNNGKTVRGKLYKVTENEITIIKGSKTLNFPVSDLSRIRIQSSAGKSFWITFGITMAVQVSIAVVIISYTKYGIFSLAGLVPTPMYLFLTGKHKRIHRLTEGYEIPSQLSLLKQYETIRNEGI